jgi:Na+-driven multidrug efflux pump
MGIAGSATATVIANITALIAFIVTIYRRDLALRLRGAELTYLRPDPAILRIIITKGFPMGLQMIAVSASALVMFGLVNAEGVDTAAAFGIALQLWTYVQMPAMAVGAAVSAIAAQNIGARRWDRVGRITRDGLLINFGLTGSVVAAALLLDTAVLGLFLPAGSAALPIAEHINLTSTWGFVLFGGTMVLFGVVRANGAVWGPLAVLFVAMFPIRLGFALALRPLLGVDALWWSFPIGSAATVGLAAAYYWHGGWRKGESSVATEQGCEQRSHADVEPGGHLTPAG